jgi:DNA-binding SARP family transcriptional activator
LLDTIRRSLLPARKVDWVYFRSIEACYLAQCGDVHAARRLAATAVELGEEAAVSPTTRCQLQISLACCHVQAGDYAAAEHWCAVAIASAQGHNQDYARNAHRFIRACALLLQQEEAQATAVLRELFAALRQPDATLSVTFASYPHLARPLFALALREGIETDYIRTIIARQRMAAPDRVTPGWPWPVAVRCLGKFECALNGSVVTATGKAQQRPLMLLKALLASGDAGKLQQSLAAELWPDASDPKAALNVTVHRLRKLLDNDEAIVVAGGKIVLAETRVWSDVVALLEVCRQCASLADDAPAASVNRLASLLLDLYRGPFCDGEDDGWLFPARDRLRSRFLAAVEQLGQRLEHAAEWATAQRLYLRAQEAEPLAETLYRGLMRTAHAQHDPAAAFSAYRRCRDTLSIVLGRKPSAETEKLAASLHLK